MLQRRLFSIADVVNNILDALPTEMWTSATTTFLDPAIGGGQFVKEIERRLREAGHSAENIKSRVFGYDSSNLRLRATIGRNRLIGTYEVKDFIESDTDMRFDVVVGNPPYQDGNKEGGQNKIYNLFCKKALELGSVVAMVTPTSVCEKSKRFSLLGLQGLKRVDFTANNHFNVGIKICSWIVDKSYDGDIEVVYDDSTITVPKGEFIYDTVDPIIDVYKRVMDLCQDTKKANNRMFKRNNHGPAFSPTESEQHCYPIYCNNRGNEYFVYTKRQPVFHNEQKLIISNTKALKEENIIVDDRDYGPSYFAYPVTTDAEVENIKSFVLSEYFVALAQEFRRIRGGQNTVLIDYCPTFDVHRLWTNEEVKNFFENL